MLGLPFLWARRQWLGRSREHLPYVGYEVHKYAGQTSSARLATLATSGLPVAFAWRVAGSYAPLLALPRPCLSSIYSGFRERITMAPVGFGYP